MSTRLRGRRQRQGKLGRRSGRINKWVTVRWLRLAILRDQRFKNLKGE